MADVEWERHGFDGRKLGFLGVQCGFLYDAYRADVDVDAVIALLGHRFDDGRTAMLVMMENAEAPSWIVCAEGAAFERKDRLRARVPMERGPSGLGQGGARRGVAGRGTPAGRQHPRGRCLPARAGTDLRTPDALGSLRLNAAAACVSRDAKTENATINSGGNDDEEDYRAGASPRR